MRLTMPIRKALTDDHASRYRASTYSERRKLLDQFITETGYNRKYASHLLLRWGLSKFLQIDDQLVKLKAGKPKRRTRTGRRTYDQRVDVALHRLWKLFDHMCGKRLAVVIRSNLSTVAKKMGIADELFPLLLRMSPAAIDRHLAAIKQRDPLRALCLTKPVSGLKALVPIRTAFQWSDSPPGFFQADTVGHDGGSSAGDFCYSLDLVDVDSGWTELRALLNKACRWVKEGLEDIRLALPFPLLGINSDSGGEFINQTIVDFCRNGIAFTRSRPNKKNDNCYVECKNDTAVRQHIGYARFSGEVAREALAAVYRALCPLINHVYPSMRLIEKQRIGSRIVKRYDRPCTPYQRLIDDSRLSPETKNRLRIQHDAIDILALTESLDAALVHLASLATHSPGALRGPADPLTPVVRKIG